MVRRAKGKTGNLNVMRSNATGRRSSRVEQTRQLGLTGVERTRYLFTTVYPIPTYQEFLPRCSDILFVMHLTAEYNVRLSPFMALVNTDITGLTNPE